VSVRVHVMRVLVAKSLLQRHRKSAYCYTFLRSLSVYMSSVCLSHSCTLLKPLDRLNAIWPVRTLVWSRDTCRMGISEFRGMGNLWIQTSHSSAKARTC